MFVYIATVSSVQVQIAAAYATTTNSESLRTYLFPNFWLNVCIVFEIAFAMLIIYAKFMHKPFFTSNLSVPELIVTGEGVGMHVNVPSIGIFWNVSVIYANRPQCLPSTVPES